MYYQKSQFHINFNYLLKNIAIHAPILTCLTLYKHMYQINSFIFVHTILTDQLV